ncbi:MAG: sulfatase-like hydrolase/transferase, partial [Spirochaetia bacterium]|nr:sulfatase-like hydrolase/transferase [Spirochaetia bacterium]MCF7954106.1 sulfatase-like hydrolase/transferase [Spirochaetales bacterium]
MTESTKRENGNEKKPNILIIMTDQQRFDSLSCYGNAGVSTPNLDRLGGEGVQFDNCYANNPICTPSRASMLTGKRITGHGVCRLHDVLPDDEVLLPEVLKEHGYHTALFGKLHVSGRIFEERQRAEHDGFDIYEWCMEPSISLESPYNGYAAWLKQKDPGFFRELKEKGRKLLHVPREYHMSHWAAERTIDLINSSDKKEQPFFCLMSVFDPHNPYEDYPEEYAERVNLDQLPEVIGLKDEEGEQKSDSISVIEAERTQSYFGSAYEIDEQQRDAIRLGYYASIALLDDEVGRVLDALDKKGIAEETMVIFLSDHGDMIGDHDLFVKGAALYDPVVKVPCLMRWPGKIPQGVRDAGLVQPSDIYNTCLSAAGIVEHGNPQERERFDSLDLLHAWKDNPE